MEIEKHRLYSSLPIYKSHKAWAEIDLDALRHNYRTLCARVAQGREKAPKVMCVLKADAYGHGADIFARTLLEEGCSAFAVSCIEEAVAIRQVCRKLDKAANILILGYTFPDSAEILVENDIIQAVFSTEYAHELNEHAIRLGCRVRCHIKLDTGMNRIGFVSQDEESIRRTALEIATLHRLEGLCIEGMFTHFAKADEPSSSGGQDMTEKQFERFMSVDNELRALGVSIPLKHVSNSAASMLFPKCRLDLVREGILLYGAMPSEYSQIPELRPVMKLKTVISHIHTLRKGETVSYGGTFSADSERIIATLPIGYADGLLRAYSGATVSIATDGGQAFAPIVGRICMDQCMIDITDTGAKVGNIVTIFGDEPSQLHNLSKRAQTIDYECLCLISGRIPRIYK